LQQSDVTKLVSSTWNAMSPADRQFWEEKAKEEKDRYLAENVSLNGAGQSWKIKKKRRKKHPGAPKRPMSAYLAFANSRRAQVQKENPTTGNGEVSKLLSTMWKNCPVDLKKEYTDEETKQWASYKMEMTAWREKADELEERTVQNALVEKMAVQQLEYEEELRFQKAKSRRLESASALFGRHPPGLGPLSSHARAPYMSLAAGALSGIPTSATLGIRNSLSPYLQTSKEASILDLLGQATAAQNATELGRMNNTISQANQAFHRKVLLDHLTRNGYGLA
jgi:hypothetical protein